MIRNANARAANSGAAGEILTENEPTQYAKAGPRLQAPLVGRLFGTNKCSAKGFAVRGNAPVLLLCRELIKAGVDPDRAIEIYRGATLALRVRSIGEAACLEINAKG